MGVYLDVPYSSQKGDPTGCWYASITMMGWFFEPGPRQGVPELWQPALPEDQMRKFSADVQAAFAAAAAWGHKPLGGVQSDGQDVVAVLMKNEGLVAVELCDSGKHDYTAAWLEIYLRKHGPLYFAWYNFGLYANKGHACVMVGVRDNGWMIYHDPGVGPRQEMHIKDWNVLRYRSPNSILRKADTVPFARVKSL